MPVSVLVVDDTEHVRRMLANMLELDGFDVVGEAASGSEAVELASATAPQVVVMDYKMPEMDGLAAARAIRTGRPDQAIILYTAFLDAELEEKAARAGIALCVEKADGILTLERDIRRLAAGSA